MKPEDVQGRRVRLMFQDEARFGRMVRIRRCWAPSPKRPTVCNGYEREFVYVYGAVSPIEGELDWMTCRQMNTERIRAMVVPHGPEDATGKSELTATDPGCAHGRPARISWARLLKRVFQIDLEHCPNCDGQLKIIAAILEAPVIDRILRHLGLEARAPPRVPAR